MAASQVEGADTAVVNDGLNELRNKLRQKNVLFILNICKDNDADVDLAFLITLRKCDILELIDEINKSLEQSNKHKKISVVKKNKFADIISKYGDEQKVALPNDTNTDPSLHITSDKEERGAIILLSTRIAKIGSCILSVSATIKDVEKTVKLCESEINQVFSLEMSKLDKRKRILLNELYKIGDDKKNKLRQQAEDLKNKLNDTKALHTQMNVILKKPIALNDVDKRKQLIVEKCNTEENKQFNINPNTNSCVTFSKDIALLEKIINTFGNVSTISTPVLLNLMNKKNGVILVKWNVLRTNKNKNEKMKVEWILHNDDEKKEEKEEWKNEIFALNDNINQTTITVTQVGVYDFQLSYNNGVQNAYSPNSNIKSISIIKIISNLIVKSNETKTLEGGQLHKFDNIIIESNGTLTTTEWNGHNGGQLMLEAHSIVIKANGRIQVDGKGYKGGKPKNKETSGTAYQGESINSAGTMNTNANKGGGGGGIGNSNYGSVGGGGGGYGTKGSDAEPNRHSGNNPGGKGGDIYGDEKITKLLLGSGGGSGHPYNGAGDGKPGGNGGGVVFITSIQITIENNGCITANGQNAPSVENAVCVSGGGGGSGGSIYIKSKELTNNGNILSIGGKGAQKGNESYGVGTCSNGGDGGYGRIRIDSSHIKKKGNIQPNIGYTQKY